MSPQDCGGGTAEGRHRIDLTGAARDGVRSSRVATFGDTALVGLPSAENGGAAVFLRRNNGVWCPEQVVTDADGYTEFGHAVALGADIAVIGAPGDDAGYAAVLRRTGDGWRETQRLAPPEESSLYAFGGAVAIGEHMIVIGASRYGDEGDIGRAFVFEGENWSTVHALTAVPELDDRFGFAVAVSGGTIVVGAPGTSERPGAAFVFEQREAFEVAHALTVEGSPGDQFGAAVAIERDDVVVGAPAQGVPNGTALVPLLDDMGKAYAFHRASGDWDDMRVLGEGLLALGDHLGSIGASVSISNGTVLVGAPGEENGRGLVRVYRRANYNGWCTAFLLYAGARELYANFGGSVSVFGTTAWVGGRESSSAAYALDLKQAEPLESGCMFEPF
jgi:hypothetical protein